MKINDPDFEWVCKLVRDRAGVALSKDKTYLVESRLAPLIEDVGVSSIGQLIAQLRRQPFNSIHRRIIEAMVNTETCFFRDDYPFDVLKKYILPELIQQRQTSRILNIWSAACSSGQEPYSIAILLDGHFPQLFAWHVQLIASDISNQMLDRARQGCYNQQEISRGLPPSLREKYFQHSSNKWQIDAKIRQRVEFTHVNLVENWPSMPQMDIIFLRNVLIYFDLRAKQTILTKARQLLQPDGYLFLGGGETTLNLDPAFEPIQLDKAICYRLRDR